MTDRKPRGMSFPSWIDQQIADAERRGVFDDLPGKGKPLDPRPTGGDYGDAWVRDYARREGVQPDELLPTPLRLRREIERLTEEVGEFRSEEEIREVAGDINAVAGDAFAGAPGAAGGQAPAVALVANPAAGGMIASPLARRR